MLIRLLKRIVKIILGAKNCRELSRNYYALKNLGPEYYPIWGCSEIPGYLLPSHMKELYNIAKRIRNQQARVVEIGSFQGKSSIIIAKGLSNKKSPKLYCIDTFDARGTKAEHEMKEKRINLEETLLENARRFKVGKLIHIRKGFSHDCVKNWTGKIDFLFIDGDHSYEAVKRDFLDWSDFVTVNGVIAFHDAWLAPPKEGGKYTVGPGKFIKEHIVPDKNYRELFYKDALYVVQKT